MRVRTFALGLSLAVAMPLSAPLSALHAQGIMGEFHRDVNEVQKKFIDLAKAMPESAYGWRPGAGVRSVREVFLHVAGENYGIPIMMGRPAPAASGITSDFNSAVAYEAKNLTETIKFFGQDWTRQRAMVLTVTHLHEHLGQMIAYARSNGVVPPWSK